MKSLAVRDYFVPLQVSLHVRGGSTGSWTGCNLKTGAWLARCCMIAAFLSHTGAIDTIVTAATAGQNFDPLFSAV